MENGLSLFRSPFLFLYNIPNKFVYKVKKLNMLQKYELEMQLSKQLFFGWPTCAHYYKAVDTAIDRNIQKTFVFIFIEYTNTLHATHE